MNEYYECLEYITNFIIKIRGEYNSPYFKRKKVLCACGLYMRLCGYYNHTMTKRHSSYLKRNPECDKYEIFDIRKFKVKKIV